MYGILHGFLASILLGGFDTAAMASECISRIKPCCCEGTRILQALLQSFLSTSFPAMCCTHMDHLTR